jgi:hypothetical protein
MKKKDRISEREYRGRLESLLKSASAVNQHRTDALPSPLSDAFVRPEVDLECRPSLGDLWLTGPSS